MFYVVSVDMREIFFWGAGAGSNVYLNLCQIWVIVCTGVSWPLKALLS